MCSESERRNIGGTTTTTASTHNDENAVPKMSEKRHLLAMLVKGTVQICAHSLLKIECKKEKKQKDNEKPIRFG